LVVDSPPEGVVLDINLDENRIERPALMSESPHPVAPFATDIRGKHRAKPVPPEPHRFVANVVSAPTENVFNIAQRQGVFHLYYHYAPDDLGRRIEMPEWVFGLGRRAENMPLLIGVNLLRQHRCDDLNRLQKRGLPMPVCK